MRPRRRFLLNVSNPNIVPVATNDAYTVPYRPTASYTPQASSILANDRRSRRRLSVARVKIVKSLNKGGTLTVNSDGTVSYTPKRGYKGTETFSYTVKDDRGATSNKATVTLTIR